MREIELYDYWLNNMGDESHQLAIIEEWLRSGILRISTPITTAASEISPPPFFPFEDYATDTDDVLALMASLREIAASRSVQEAIVLRTAVARVVSMWDFDEPDLLPAIRLSFRIASIFGCLEVCDELASRARRLSSSPLGVITGLSDMASEMSQPGNNLINLLLALSAEQPGSSPLVPYLLTRAIEASVKADCQTQRELVFGLMERYGPSLNPEAIDAIEALTDAFVTHLRLTEAPLDRLHFEKLWNVAAYLHEDILLEAPALLDKRDSLVILQGWLKSHGEAGNTERYLEQVDEEGLAA